MKRQRPLHIITLGCAKNLVDSERLINQLSLGGLDITHGDTPVPAHTTILNTCAFIADAKEESVDMILDLVQAKKRGETETIIVFGCLSQRYKEQLREEIPEVDHFFGCDDLNQMLEVLHTPLFGEQLYQRRLTTPSHYAYLKVSEGCNRKCAFCIIPSIRGAYTSTPIDELMREAQFLGEQGVKELLLVAQDLSSYGTDINQHLKTLLTELETINGIEWIRLHYAYPSGFPTEIIPVMAASEKIVPYLDIPFQHASDNLLKAMRRGHTAKQNHDIINRLRKEIPHIALRTTLITGFPGETEDDYRILSDFVQEVQFDRLGVFPFSAEEGTHAATLPDDIPQKLKEERAEAIMEIQESISFEKNQTYINRVVDVITDRREGELLIGRTKADSPEVDQEVIIRNAPGIQEGAIIPVQIEDAAPFDLYGTPA